MRYRFGVLFAVVAFVAAACGDDGDGPATPLRPADEILADRAQENAIVGVIGEPVTLENGVVVTVESIELNPDFVPGEAWQATHHLEVRAENPTSEDSTAPWFEMFCGDSVEGGGWMVSSTYPMGSDLPAGSFAEGQLDLHIPDVESSGVARDDCEEVFVELDGSGGGFTITWGDQPDPPVYRFQAPVPSAG